MAGFTWLCAILCQYAAVMVMTAADDGDQINWTDFTLPEEHQPAVFHNNPTLRDSCDADDSCPYKSAIEKSSKECWGYEKDCPVKERLPACPGDDKGWARFKKEDQIRQFWETADFGFVSQQRKELVQYCTPSHPDDSSLVCSKHLRFCRAKNIYIDFSTAALSTSTNQYRNDVIGPGQIGGHCKLDKRSLQSQLDHKSFLQSWAAEMEHYTSFPFRPIVDKKCDIIIDKPTYLIKLDATVNMYHHFCDYVNLYVSQHVNNSFSKDVTIILWDTSGHKHTRMFSETWKAYTKHRPLFLHEFDGKKVCVKDAVFSLLARMRGGLYYNMPLMPGCYGSSLVRAFSHHLIYRLGIPQYGPLENKVRVTLLARSTKFRKILNQNELVAALKTDNRYEVRIVDYTRSVPFLEQLELTHNSDVFIGMHGAGLTHMLFQPDWGVIFELYNCEDAGCYFDLSRLRGLKYITWERKQKLVQEDEGHHPTLGPHAKFTNYAFDVEEFMRLIEVAWKHVTTHPSFLKAREEKYARLQEEKSGDTSVNGRDAHTEL